eukprot:m.91804 g.91804  ORF g.91804 m.91804 type:complete len:339 (+) comp11984_c0_seq1:940-1956(+)
MWHFTSSRTTGELRDWTPRQAGRHGWYSRRPAQRTSAREGSASLGQGGCSTLIRTALDSAQSRCGGSALLLTSNFTGGLPPVAEISAKFIITATPYFYHITLIRELLSRRPIISKLKDTNAKLHCSSYPGKHGLHSSKCSEEKIKWARVRESRIPPESSWVHVVAWANSWHADDVVARSPCAQRNAVGLRDPNRGINRLHALAASHADVGLPLREARSLALWKRHSSARHVGPKARSVLADVHRREGADPVGRCGRRDLLVGARGASRDRVAHRVTGRCARHALKGDAHVASMTAVAVLVQARGWLEGPIRTRAARCAGRGRAQCRHIFPRWAIGAAV